MAAESKDSDVTEKNDEIANGVNRQKQNDDLLVQKTLRKGKRVRTKDDKDIIFIDTDRLPKREHFKNKKEFKQAVREFISYLEAFILTYVDTHHFLIVVHGGSEKCAIKDELRRKIYNKLKTGFLDRLSKCIIFKPQRKLKALALFLRPFLNREMKQKIAMTTSKRYLHDIQGIPDFVTKHL
ncbi:uncharacterized protein LOC113665753 [Pocillopora damicornis]|uniref:uncharacterized protein LOC113665753 n=1 Tax=Pocillopora damicornis TaxID=46731 RepID=UPI000F55558B|nr:uncharacterized protein LOC113665753 [Pocillopora damicornis]